MIKVEDLIKLLIRTAKHFIALAEQLLKEKSTNK